MSAPRQRVGLSIAAKLVLATSFVVAAAVVITTFVQSRAIDELNDMHVEARRSNGEKAISSESERIVQSTATTIALPLGSHQYPDVKSLADAALVEEKGRGNRIRWMVIADDAGAEVFRSPAAPPADKVKALEGLLADGVKNGNVTHARVAQTGTDWVYGAPIKVVDPDTHVDRAVGALRIGVSTEDLENELHASLDRAKDRVASARTKAWLFSALILGIGIVIAALQGIALARPIRQLTTQAERIAHGDLESRVPEGRRDELGTLAHSFNQMANDINTLMVERLHKASLEKEMDLAREVQQAMLPPDRLDQHGAFKVVGYCQPATAAGGDWWAYHKLTNGRMLLVLGDATGHGIHSAMIAATARGAVEALAGIDERLLTPEQVLRAIDSAIRNVGEHNVLMTAFAAVFDSTTGILHYANAGQNFPYVLKLDDQHVIGTASIIAASGNPLGDRNIPIEVRRGSLQMRAGDLFVCFTDGVVERANPQGKLFGDRRLRTVLTGQTIRDPAALIALRDRVIAQLDQYAEGAIAQDDITLVLCQYDPASMVGGDTRRERTQETGPLSVSKSRQGAA